MYDAREIKVLEQTYQIGRLSAHQQFHLVRRLVPAAASLMTAAAGLKREGAEGEALPGDLFAKLEPFTQMLGRMTDEDADYLLDTCLSCVRRRIPGDRGWAKIGTSQALMFEDIDLAVMMQLAFEAGRENLGGFFDAVQRLFPGLLEKAKETLNS